MTAKEFYYADPYIATATEIATSFKIWKLFIKSKVRVGVLQNVGIFFFKFFYIEVFSDPKIDKIKKFG